MSIAKEAMQFLLNHKKLWLIPILTITFLLLILILSEGVSVAKFSYAMF